MRFFLYFYSLYTNLTNQCSRFNTTSHHLQLLCAILDVRPQHLHRNFTSMAPIRRHTSYTIWIFRNGKLQSTFFSSIEDIRSNTSSQIIRTITSATATRQRRIISRLTAVRTLLVRIPILPMPNLRKPLSLISIIHDLVTPANLSTDNRNCKNALPSAVSDPDKTSRNIENSSKSEQTPHSMTFFSDFTMRIS